MRIDCNKDKPNFHITERISVRHLHSLALLQSKALNSITPKSNMLTSDWDTLRRGVRNLENELDQGISNYSKLATQLATSYYSSQSSTVLQSSREDARRLEVSIGDMLDKVRWMSNSRLSWHLYI